MSSIRCKPAFAFCRIFIKVSRPKYLTTSAGNTNSPSLSCAGISSRTSFSREPTGTSFPETGSTEPPSSFSPPSSKRSICLRIVTSPPSLKPIPVPGITNPMPNKPFFSGRRTVNSSPVLIKSGSSICGFIASNWSIDIPCSLAILVKVSPCPMTRVSLSASTIVGVACFSEIRGGGVGIASTRLPPNFSLAICKLSSVFKSTLERSTASLIIEKSSKSLPKYACSVASLFSILTTAATAFARLSSVILFPPILLFTKLAYSFVLFSLAGAYFAIALFTSPSNSFIFFRRSYANARNPISGELNTANRPFP